MQTRVRNSLRGATRDDVTDRFRWSISGVVALIFGTALLALLLYAASVHSFAGNSDGATVMLEGQSMSAGHLTLHGWSFTLESFWSIDAVVYAAVIRVVGLHPELIHAVPALIATLVVLLGGYLTVRGRRGTSAYIGACTVVALLGLPSANLAYYLLAGPLHVATALWCLIAFAGLSRGRFGWGWTIAVLFLAAGLLGDFMSLAIGVVPVIVAGVMAMLRTRNWRAGVAAVVAAPASIAVALLVRTIARAIGTFAIVNRNFPVSGTQIGWNVRHLPTFFAGLLGVGTLPTGLTGGPLILQVFHAIGALAFIAGILIALVNLARSIIGPARKSASEPLRWHLDDLLLIGFFGDLCTFVLFSPNASSGGLRYLTPGVIFGAILAGRATSRAIESLRGIRARRLVVVAVSLVIVTFGIDLAIYLSHQAPVQPVTRLASFLEHHDLTTGVGDYWSASIVTVETEGAIVVRPITADALGHFYRFNRQSSATWYSGQPFEFFAFGAFNHERDVDKKFAIAMFGKPTHTYVIGSYRVLTWSQPLIFSSSLPPQTSPLDIGW